MQDRLAQIANERIDDNHNLSGNKSIDDNNASGIRPMQPKSQKNIKASSTSLKAILCFNL